MLSRLRVSPRKFVLTGRLVKGHCVKATRSNRAKPRCTREIKLRVTYRLDTAAQVTIKLMRRQSGRRVNGRCVTPTRKNRTRPGCTRWVEIAGKLTRTAKKGSNSFTWSGRIGQQKLGPGSYRLIATPDTDGHNGTPRAATFGIVV